MNLSINNNDTYLTSHACKVRRENDWVIYTCPHCEGYERRQNLKTGAMQVQGATDSEILHHGSYVPELIKTWTGSAN